MQHDPWKAVHDALEQPAVDQFIADPDLTPANQVRKDLDEDFVTGHDPSINAHDNLEAAACVDQELLAGLQEAVNQSLDRPPALLYYPGCGRDLTLAHAFPQARTIFVDDDGDVEHSFVQHNLDHPDQTYEFHRADMHTFKLPDDLKADVVLILNAGSMTISELDAVVAADGVVIVNDWHGAATTMKQYASYALRTVIDMGIPENDLYVFNRQDTRP